MWPSPFQIRFLVAAELSPIRVAAGLILICYFKKKIHMNLMIRICFWNHPYVGAGPLFVSVVSFKNIKKWAVTVKVTVKSIIIFYKCFTMKCNLSTKLFKNSWNVYLGNFVKHSNQKNNATIHYITLHKHYNLWGKSNGEIIVKKPGERHFLCS